MSNQLYEAVSVNENPDMNAKYMVICKDGSAGRALCIAGSFIPLDAEVSDPTTITHWLKPITSPLLTKEVFDKICEIAMNDLMKAKGLVGSNNDLPYRETYWKSLNL